MLDQSQNESILRKLRRSQTTNSGEDPHNQNLRTNFNTSDMSN